MPFLTRAVIAILAGIGASTLGFVAIWNFVERVLHADPGVGYTPWLLTAIFTPLVLVPALVFRAVSRAAALR
jgi:hypothetical protein